MTKASVVLADDHPVFLVGIQHHFKNLPNFEVVGTANNGEACLGLLSEHQPDWAIVDLAMPKSTGFEVLERAVEISPRTRIILISMHADMVFSKLAAELGAVGFIAKEDATSELDRALLMEHGQFFSGKSVGRSVPTISARPNSNQIADLTPTELTILRHLGEGLTSREIGGSLEISPRTVQKHRENMSRKLGLVGPNRLLEFAIRNLRNLEK